MPHATLNTIEELIVNGKVAEARRALRLWAQKKIARPHVLKTANLCRRTGLAPLALRLLNPIVRPKGKSGEKPNDGEKAEYAALLTFIGASEEAVVLLHSIPAQSIPQVLLYEAFALFSQWDYEAAIPVLKRYLDFSSLTPYQRLVGELNLLAALVDERHDEEADTRLTQFLRATEKDFSLLHLNALELSAQLALFREQWKQADHFLERARVRLTAPDSTEAFLLQKWTTVGHFLRSEGTGPEYSAMLRLRAEAEKKANWETIRDCDRFLAVRRRDPKLLARVYYGSPYPRFRARLLADFGAGAEIPAEFLWTISKGKEAPGIFDLRDGNWVPKNKSLKVGQSLHRLMVALASDFYRPLKVAVAHHRLHPQETYHPLSSPPRVYEAIRHLRHWLKRQRVPLEIREFDGFYRLLSDVPVGILIRGETGMGSAPAAFLARFRQHWADRPFSVSEVSGYLKVSKRTALRLLEKMVKEEQTLERSGSGPATRYKLVA